jgi:hypothetical protein
MVKSCDRIRVILNNTVDNLKWTLKIPDMNVETAGPGYIFKRFFFAFSKTSGSGKLSAAYSIPVQSEYLPRRKPNVADPGTDAYLTPGSGIGLFPDPGSQTHIDKFMGKKSYKIIVCQLAQIFFLYLFKNKIILKILNC